MVLNSTPYVKQNNDDDDDDDERKKNKNELYLYDKTLAGWCRVYTMKKKN